MSELFSPESLLMIMAPEFQGMEQFFTNLAKEELSKVGNEYSDNEKEKDATLALIDSTKAEIKFEGDSVSLSFSFGNSEWLNVIEGGVSGQVLGGDNGTITNPDGSTEPSKVPPHLWGRPFPEGYEPPSHIVENLNKMASTLFYNEVSELINSDLVKTVIEQRLVEYIKERLGG